MATPAQSLTNKQNAQHSTGPRTAEGKQKSSLNALRHGLTGQLVVLPGEDAQAYAAFRETVFHDFAPSGSLELVLIQTICDTQWRLERARNLETNLVALAHHEDIPAAIAAVTDPAERTALITAHGYDKRERTLRNLQLQEARLQRTLFKALADLKEAQAARRDAAQALLNKAVDTRTDCRNNNIPFDPAALGFDFTEAELDREVTRRYSRGNLRKRYQPVGGERSML